MNNKVININSDKDLNKFYHKIRFYKIFFNKKNIKLVISEKIKDDDKEELLMCEKAFNIKDKYKRLVYTYETLCGYLDKKYVNKNICEFDKNGLCLCQREYHHPASKNGCCGLCTYLGKNGCTINSLACKTHFCKYIIKKKMIPSYRKIKLYKYFFSAPQKILATINFWNTEKENIKLMKKNSLIAIYFMKFKKMKRW